MRQQLITVNRKRSRSARLTTVDRFIFVFLSSFISISRLQKIEITVKPETILKFHKALVKRKYKLLVLRHFAWTLG